MHRHHINHTANKTTTANAANTFKSTLKGDLVSLSLKATGRDE